MKVTFFAAALTALASTAAVAQTGTATSSSTSSSTSTSTGTSTAQNGVVPPPPPAADDGTKAAIDDCKTNFNTAMQSEPKPSQWDSGPAGGALFHFHDAVWAFNVGDLADAEQMFCELTTGWQVGTSITTLPQTVSKTGPDGNTVVLNLTAPTESFATTAGYTVKATLSFNGTQFMAMWWTGTSNNTKGYLIQGANPMQPDGNSRLKYAQWDLTGTSQLVKVYAAQFVTASGFLVSASNSQSAGGQVGVHFSRATFNTSTQEINAQVTRINIPGGSTSFSCAKDWFDGVVGGTIAAYHISNQSPYSGSLPVTDTNKDNTAMVGISDLTDSTSSTGGAQGAAPTTVSFDYSCNDLDTANGSTGPFANGTVSYTADPSTIFPD